MKTDERVSYMMLFCALLLVKNGKASLAQSVTIVPLLGGARNLAGELAKQVTLLTPTLSV
ncbi:MAG: hypothetical protein HY648_05225 [Acidobacteria bacterium]|nr:hypothetical protein [Acidobacteriota bacterium]